MKRSPHSGHSILLRVDAAELVRRDGAPALRADSVEGRHDFFQIDFLLLGHAENFLTLGEKGISDLCRWDRFSVLAFQTRHVADGGHRFASSNFASAWRRVPAQPYLCREDPLIFGKLLRAVRA
jgi:hypothetical protein